MEHLLFILIGLFLGVSLGMATMGLVIASDRDQLPEPAPGNPRAGRASWPEVPESSLAGIGVSRDGESSLGLADSPHGASATWARDSA